jgi:hypothetical protein
MTRENEMSSELFQMIGHALAPLSAQADMKLHWTEYDLEYGWCLHLGYSASGDPDDDGDISISRVILNTGQREVTLAAADLDSATWFGCEEACREDWRKSYEVQP